MKQKIAFCISVVLLFSHVFLFTSKKESLPTSVDTDPVPVPILMYHQVLDLPSKLGKYVVSTHEFEADLKYLSDLGYETVTVSDLIEFCEGRRALPKKPVMLTFDDGYQTDYLNVFPLLKKYNMKAVFSIVGAYTERYSTPGIDKHINYAHLCWDEISEMESSGLCEFQNHSYDMHSLSPRHGCLREKGETSEHYTTVLHADIEHSQKLFSNALAKSPVCFTYPYGGTDDTLRKLILDEGFSATLGTYEEINLLTEKKEELFDLRRFNRAHGRDITKIFEKAEKLREKTSS